MKRLLILPAAALFFVSASPPELDSVNAAPAPTPVAKPAAAARAPVAAKTGYPPCTATRTDRCTQVPRAVQRYAAPKPRNRQLAMRAGERG